MTSDTKDQAAIERRLWNDIERHQTGMLGLVDCNPAHFQPMTAFAETGAGQIWFFTRDDTDLVRQVGARHGAMFVFQTRELHACIGGDLMVDHDGDRIRKYWNAVVAAWHPGGRDDPRLTMLRLDCSDAQVWLSEGPLRFAWEIVKANATKHEPHVGRRADLSFH